MKKDDTTLQGFTRAALTLKQHDNGRDQSTEPAENLKLKAIKKAAKNKVEKFNKDPELDNEYTVFKDANSDSNANSNNF